MCGLKVRSPLTTLASSQQSGPWQPNSAVHLAVQKGSLWPQGKGSTGIQPAVWPVAAHLSTPSVLKGSLWPQSKGTTCLVYWLACDSSTQHSICLWERVPC